MGQNNISLDSLPYVPSSHATNLGIWSRPLPPFWANIIKFDFQGIPRSFIEKDFFQLRKEMSKNVKLELEVKV